MKNDGASPQDDALPEEGSAQSIRELLKKFDSCDQKLLEQLFLGTKTEEPLGPLAGPTRQKRRKRG